MVEPSFYESHPRPNECGINSLFRFYKIDQVEHLRYLFTERKLYHPLPSQFNDPFECKPHFSLPKGAKQVRKIRQYLYKCFREDGYNKKKAEEAVSSIMKYPKHLQKTIFNIVQKRFARLRVCSFTTQKDNLLFWSHYADSHKGFCVEFDATKVPIVYALKVQYKNKYPEVIFPFPSGPMDFMIPALIKSEIWKHEEEFRSFFVPDTKDPANNNDGDSLILKGDEVKNVYLGSNIDKNNKELIFDLIKQGDFNPGIWITSLSESSFSLKFDQVG